MKDSPAGKNKKKIYIGNLEDLQQEFYRSYDPDYWLYRASLLKDSHDNYSQLASILEKNIKDASDEDYKRVIRTEMHFLYFQMTETLFELMFALAKHDNRNLWLALTFSNARETAFYSDSYTKISKFAQDDTSEFDLLSKLKLNDKKIPLIQWLFYFTYEPKLDENDSKKNLEVIQKILKEAAKDFSDRGEYNAYKHSLRLYNTSFHVSIRNKNNEAFSLGGSDDAITFLEPYYAKEDIKKERLLVSKRSKPFSFDRDYSYCLLLHALIKNLVEVRKSTILPESIGKEFTFTLFHDVDLLAKPFDRPDLLNFRSTV